MKVAHVILAHKDPAQLKRLLLRLYHSDSLVFVHLDKKSNADDFGEVVALPNVHFVKKRIAVNWGGFSQVEAVVNSFKEITDILPNADYINLLSGQDYPIKSIDNFHDFLWRNQGRAFMEFLPADHDWVIAAKERFNKYHFSDVDFSFKYRIEKLITFLMPERAFPYDFKLIGKSQWFTIDSDCMHYILQFINKKPGIYQKFKYSWGADELVFQSIIYNSPLANKLVNNNLRYIDWSEKQSSPKTLTIADKEKLIQSEAFFARKFDLNVDPKIVEFLDREILLRRQD